MQIATTVWVLHLIFTQPIFPNGGFVASKPFASQKECLQAMNEVGLTIRPSYNVDCVAQNGAE